VDGVGAVGDTGAAVLLPGERDQALDLHRLAREHLRRVARHRDPDDLGAGLVHRDQLQLPLRRTRVLLRPLTTRLVRPRLRRTRHRELLALRTNLQTHDL